jgi:hypothetical protein
MKNEQFISDRDLLERPGLWLDVKFDFGSIRLFDWTRSLSIIQGAGGSSSGRACDKPRLMVFKFKYGGVGILLLKKLYFEGGLCFSCRRA